MNEREIEKVIYEHKEQIHSILREIFLTSSKDSFQKLGNWFDKYRELTDAFFTKIARIDNKDEQIRLLHEHIIFRRKILSQLDQWIRDPKEFEVDSIFQAFDTQLESYLKNIPPYWIIYQLPQRFTSQPGDAWIVRFYKWLKRTGYYLHTLPVRFVNWYKNLRKKEKKSLPGWIQKIPGGLITRWYYNQHFTERFLHLQDNVLKNTAILADKFWESDHRFYGLFEECINGTISRKDLLEKWEQQIIPDLLDVRQQVDKDKDSLDAEFSVLLREVDIHFEEQVSIAGTLEFKSFKHRETRLRKQTRSIRQKLRYKLKKRFNTLYTLADDWKFNQEIYMLKGSNQKSFLTFHSRLLARKETVNTFMDAIPAVLTDTLEKIKKEDPAIFRANLLQLKQNTGKVLNTKIIPDLYDCLVEQGFPIVIDDIEQSLQNELHAMTSKRILIEGFDPAKDYPDKALHTIIPMELVEFEMMAKVRKVLLHSKSLTLENLEKVKTEVDNMGRMVVFNLDSAIVQLDDQGEKELENSFIDVKASMERAIQNYQELKDHFNQFIFSLLETIDGTLKEFSVHLTALTDNSRVAEIRYRITRAKALKKSEQVLLQIKNIYQTVFGKTISLYRLSQKKMYTGLETIRGQLGIHENARDITFEISDYLVSGDISLQKLPFVYRRLFENEPLKETTFFHRREEEITKLYNAFEKWKQGSFTPVIIYGEKGSGISTFINIFVKEKIRYTPEVYSIAPAKRIQTEEELLAMLGLSLRGEAFAKVHELYEFTEKREPFVACIDKLHMLFLRNPGGFNVLKKFFEIISLTSRKVFWICTCGLYSSLYLDKSVGLFSYFPVIISMKNLSRKDVRNVIMLRHKASGYDLFFKPSKQDVAEKAFQKKNLQEQQQYLMDKYFATLNKHTQSNIAFALQLWIRSAEKASDNRIMLNSLDSLDFSFIFNLPAEVTFGLHALLIHERLDVFQLSQVLNISRRQAYLLLMRLSDRGIVIDEKGIYTIHQLLYRQIILLLKVRNLLH